VLRLVGFLVVFVIFIIVQNSARDFNLSYSTAGIIQREASGFEGGACPAQCSARLLAYSGLAHTFRIFVIIMTVFGVCLTWIGRDPWLQRLENTQTKYYAPMIKAAGLILWFGVFLALVYGLGSGIGAAISLRDPTQYPGVQLAANFGDQNSWTFGQLVAVVLLVLPFMAALEGFLGKNYIDPYEGGC
jgi:hypothetical protein